MSKPALTIQTGCDVVYIPRFEAMLERTPEMLGKLFTAAEQRDTGIQSLAGIYAAKEAIIKAMDLKLTDLSNIEIRHSNTGRPFASIRGHSPNLDISISHDGDYALAFAALLRQGSPTNNEHYRKSSVS